MSLEASGSSGGADAGYELYSGVRSIAVKGGRLLLIDWQKRETEIFRSSMPRTGLTGRGSFRRVKARSAPWVAKMKRTEATAPTRPSPV